MNWGNSQSEWIHEVREFTKWGNSESEGILEVREFTIKKESEFMKWGKQLSELNSATSERYLIRNSSSGVDF